MCIQMQRSKLLIASPSAAICQALTRFVGLLPRDLLCRYEIRSGIFQSADELFDLLEDFQPEALRDLLVVCDLAGVDSLPWNIRQLGMYGTGVAAQLILSFPEVHFVFLGCPAPPFLGDSAGILVDDLTSAPLVAVQEKGHHRFLQSPGPSRL